ncbi:hypothetical protein GCM10009692_02280 [Leucobacter aridicollis]
MTAQHLLPRRELCVRASIREVTQLSCNLRLSVCHRPVGKSPTDKGCIECRTALRETAGISSDGRVDR